MVSRLNLINASWVVLLAALLGAILFQTCSIAFDYMKLRQLPIYATAGSLAEFNAAVESLNDEMAGSRQVARGALLNRATIDLDIAAAEEQARVAIVQARTLLRGNLDSSQISSIGFNSAAIRFTDTDRMFQRVCNTQQNAQAVEASADLAEAPTVQPASSQNIGLTTQQQSVFGSACSISREDCVDDKPSPRVGERERMICTQTRLQALTSRASTLDAFSFDGAAYLSEALRLSYPSIVPDDAIRVIQVAESYRSLVRTNASKACVRPADATSLACRDRNLMAPLWDFLFAQPLALMYLALAFIFGSLGSVTSYLFATVAPESIAPAPEDAPWYAGLAGGGSAILVLLVVMAGFQFLAAGASTPDLAYPNPLTVCGLSVLVGLRGDAVLVTLKEWIGRFFTGSNERGSRPIDEAMDRTAENKPVSPADDPDHAERPST